MKSDRKGLNVATKVIGLVTAVLLAVVALNYVVFVAGFRDSADEAMVEKAAAFTAVADEAKTHAGKLLQNGSVDRDALIAEAVEALQKGGHYRDTRFYNTIPVVVGWTTAREAAKKEGIDFAVPAFDARNKENEPAPGTFRAKLLADLEQQIAQGGAPTINRVNAETNTLHFLRAIELDASCMACHGDPAVYDKDGDGKDLLGFRMEGWKVGDTHGAFEVAMPLAPVDNQVAGFITGGLTWTVPVLIAAGFGFFFAMRAFVTKPVARMVAVMSEVGKGDLTQRVDINRGDEIGTLATSMDGFLNNVHGMVKNISASSRDVASAATEIAASNDEMATGLTDQQRQTEQAAAAVEELNRSTADIARQSSEAAATAQHSRESAAEGGAVVQKTVEEITAIAVQVSESAQAVAALSEKSERIGGVINVINDIADQTNLLALNAAIEAARAGEHGRGFAVVADEVRKLAERTTQATAEVASSIREIQTETGKAVERIEAGSTRMNAGVEVARTAGKSLGAIVQGSDDLMSKVQCIAAAAEEQAAAAEQIGRSMQSVREVSDRSSRSASEAVQAAGDLSRQSESMRQLVEGFKV